MKLKGIMAAAALVCAFAASAQYAPTKEGMVLDYKSTVKDVEKPVESTDSVKSVTTADGVTTVSIKSCLHSDNPLADDMVIYTSYKYTTPDAPTTVVMMSAEEFKKFILNITKMALEEAGQYSESLFKEATDAMKAKGELSLELNPKGAVGDKIANSRLRLHMGMQAATMFVSNGAIAGYEDVTVSAGTFANCIKVTYESRENSAQGNQKHYVTAWYAPETGLVKEVKTDKKGNVLEEQELVSIK